MGREADRLRIVSMNSAGRNGKKYMDFRRTYLEEVIGQEEPDILLLPGDTPDMKKTVVMNYSQLMVPENNETVLLYDPKRLKMQQTDLCLKLPNIDNSKLVFPSVDVLAAPPLQTKVKTFQCVTWHWTLAEAPSDQRYKQGEQLMMLSELLAWLTGTEVLLGGDFNLPLEQIQTLIRDNNRRVQQGLENVLPFFRELGYLDSMAEYVQTPDRMLRQLKLHQCESFPEVSGNPNYFVASKELQLLQTSTLEIQSSTGKFTSMKALEYCPPPTKAEVYLPARPPRHHGG